MALLKPMRFNSIIIVGLFFTLACTDSKDPLGDSSSPVDVGTGADGTADSDADSGDDTGSADEDSDGISPVTDDRTASGSTWCAACGLATDGVHTHVGCFAPADVAAGPTATDGVYTLHPGPFRRVAP